MRRSLLDVYVALLEKSISWLVKVVITDISLLACQIESDSDQKSDVNKNDQPIQIIHLQKLEKFRFGN